MSDLQEIRVPNIGDFKEVNIIDVLVGPDEQVTEGQSLIVVETDKAAMEIPSTMAGVIKKLEVVVGDKISEGALIAWLEAAQRVEPTAPFTEAVIEVIVAPDAAVAIEQTSFAAADVSKHELAFASPSVRRLARELGVSLKGIKGSGPRARILKEDIEQYVKRVMDGQIQASSLVQSDALNGLLPWPQVDFARFGPVERQALSRIKKMSGANLHRNWVMIPHVTNHDDADVTELEAFRVQMNATYQKEGVKVTLLALVMKACAGVLKAFPEFNASLNGDELVLKRYFHMGFAADTPNGLVVPVIRDVDQKGVLTIAREMAELSAKAREGKLGTADMSGGSFTISSLGGIGGTYFTPIINAPEVAILGLGRSVNRVCWDGEKAVPRLMLPLSLSWDHRVIDGAMAGRFNVLLGEFLKDYRRLML